MSSEVEQCDKDIKDDLTSHVGTNHVCLHSFPSGRRFQYGEWSRQCGGFGAFSFYRSWGSYRTGARRNDDGDFASIAGMMIILSYARRDVCHLRVALYGCIFGRCNPYWYQWGETLYFEDRRLHVDPCHFANVRTSGKFVSFTPDLEGTGYCKYTIRCGLRCCFSRAHSSCYDMTEVISVP